MIPTALAMKGLCCFLETVARLLSEVSFQEMAFIWNIHMKYKDSEFRIWLV